MNGLEKALPFCKSSSSSWALFPIYSLIHLGAHSYDYPLSYSDELWPRIFPTILLHRGRLSLLLNDSHYSRHWWPGHVEEVEEEEEAPYGEYKLCTRDVFKTIMGILRSHRRLLSNAQKIKAAAKQKHTLQCRRRRTRRKGRDNNTIMKLLQWLVTGLFACKRTLRHILSNIKDTYVHYGRAHQHHHLPCRGVK